MNQAFVANPAFLLGLPYSGIVAGFASPQDWGMISGFMYDPKDRTQDFFDLGDLYAKGVIVGGEVKVNERSIRSAAPVRVRTARRIGCRTLL